MSDEHTANADGAGAFQQDTRLAGTEMARSKDAAGGPDELEDVLDLGPEPAVFIDSGETAGLTEGAAVVERGTGRHPYLLRTELQRDLDRGRVEAADGLIQNDPAEDPDAGHDLRDEPGSLDRRELVTFDEKRAHTGSRGFTRELEVVVAAGIDVGRAVDVEVDGAFEEVGNVHEPLRRK
jgi:hypothetical protein